MKTIFLVLFLIIPLNLFAPNHKVNINWIADNLIINDNLKLLKNNTIKTREEVFNLIQPVIHIWIKRHGYEMMFINMQDSVSYAIACIFVSESSNAKGQSSRSSLWLEHNNPFGLTNSQGVTLKSWEMINGERVVMNRTFRQFTSFQEAIYSLLNDYLNKDAFNNTVNSSTVYEFLHNLQSDGYCTNKGWPKWAYNQIYLKYKS